MPLAVANLVRPVPLHRVIELARAVPRPVPTSGSGEPAHADEQLHRASRACGTSARTRRPRLLCAPGRAQSMSRSLVASTAETWPPRSQRSPRITTGSSTGARERPSARDGSDGQAGHADCSSLPTRRARRRSAIAAGPDLVEPDETMRVLGGDHRLVVGDVADQLAAEVGHRLAEVGAGTRTIDDVAELVAQPEAAQRLGAAIRVLHAARRRHDHDEDVIARADRGGGQRRFSSGRDVEHDEVEPLHVELAEHLAEQRRRDRPLRVHRALRAEQDMRARRVA